jgi:hypothetical protein
MREGEHGIARGQLSSEAPRLMTSRQACTTPRKPALNQTVGTCLALSVAALFVAGCDKGTSDDRGKPGVSQAPGMPAAPTGDQVKCLGIHECKGQSACHVLGKDGHACAGQNACKGKGWISVTAKECTAKGGKVLEG